MIDIKKIDLAASDLAAAVVEAVSEHAEYRAAKIVNERIEQLSREIDSKLERIEARSVTNIELNAAHGRITRLESRISDLEKQLQESEDDPRTIIADMINDGDLRLHVD